MYRLVGLHLLLLLILPKIVQGEAAMPQYEQARDLKKSLLVYDSKQKSYVPYVYGTPFNANAASFVLNLKENEGLYLEIYTKGKSALFIENDIVALQKGEEGLLLDIDSLRRSYGAEEIFMTLYQKELNLNTSIISIVRKVENQVVNNRASDGIEILLRDFSSFKNYYIIGLMLILTLLAMLKATYSRAFGEFYNISRIFSVRWKEDSIIMGKPISGASFLFLMMYCLVVAFVTQAFLHETGSSIAQFSIGTHHSVTASLFSWFFLTLMVFLLMIIKLVVIWVASSLLGFKDMTGFHFFDYIRISQILLFLLLIVVTLSVLSYNSFLASGNNVAGYVFGITVLLTVILLFFKLLSTPTYRNMHLISYLCTTEILPLIIGIKFFLDI